MKIYGIFLLFSCFSISFALRCYTCSVTESDVDQSCVDNPNVTNSGSAITNCNKKYCTTIRVEYKDPKNRVQSMYRGCEDEPMHKNEIIEDATYRIYYVACTTDLCNGGPGKSSNGATNNALGDKSTIYCPGTRSAGNKLSSEFILIVLLLSIFISCCHFSRQNTYSIDSTCKTIEGVVDFEEKGERDFFLCKKTHCLHRIDKCFVCGKKKNNKISNDQKNYKNNTTLTDEKNGIIFKLTSPTIVTSNEHSSIQNNHHLPKQDSFPNKSGNDLILTTTSKIMDKEINGKFISVLVNIFPDIEPEFINKLVEDKVYTEENLNIIISHILTLDVYPRRQEQSSQTTTNVEKRYDFLKNLFPDADPEYLLLRTHEFNDDTEKIEHFIDSMLATSNYPRLEIKRQRERFSAQLLRYREAFNVAEYLKDVPEPLATFSKSNRQKSKKQIDHISAFYIYTFLRNHFSNVPVRTIHIIYNSFNHLGLYNVVKKLKKFQKHKTMQIKKSRKPMPLPEPPHNIPLLQEIAFIVHEKEILDYMEMVSKTRLIQIEEAKLNGTILQCECCYNDEILPDESFKCENDHKFCKKCVQKSCAIRFGEGLISFPCLCECNTEFSIQTLQLALEPKLFSNIVKKVDLHAVKSAGLTDLECCPFCDFVSIPAEDDKLFHCMNDECLKESCRQCKGLAHLPYRCDEVEQDVEVKNRTYIENKMSEALLRKCWRCGVSFYKVEGCNKMKCRCGAFMCYICRKPIESYDHFRDSKDKHSDKCPLYTNTFEFNKNNVLEAAQKAKKKLAGSGTVLLKHDPSLDVDYHYKRRKMIPQGRNRR